MVQNARHHDLAAGGGSHELDRQCTAVGGGRACPYEPSHALDGAFFRPVAVGHFPIALRSLHLATQDRPISDVFHALRIAVVPLRGPAILPVHGHGPESLTRRMQQW